MNVFLIILKNLFFLLLINAFGIILSQIYDNFSYDTLEEGNYDLLDVTDYHNKNLIVSTSKSIYMGIPPKKIIETNANLINATALITINDNFLLAACLKDSFLGKINLSTGNFISLLTYSDVSISPGLDIPITLCSLSNIDNSVFIGYSRIDYFDTEINKTNIILKLNILNKESVEEGPILDDKFEIKYFVFPQSTVKTSSLRQISCEPIKVTNDLTQYRLICLHEDVLKYEYLGEMYSENALYATSINSDFDDFEVEMFEYLIRYGDKDLGFRIFRENSTYARCLAANYLGEIYLELTPNSLATINKVNSLPQILKNFDSDTNLVYYNNKFRFSSKKTSFMGKSDIYSFQINQNYYSNYFILYNYQDKMINKMLGYYNETIDKIIFLYQSDNGIKYFIMDNRIDIYTFGSDNELIKLKSYEKYQYDLNDWITSPSLNDLGNLNVESIEYEFRNGDNLKEYYGQDFYETLLSNNIFFPEPSLNDWKTYYLSFIENIENKYTRIYHIDSLTIEIQTCESACYSCWDDYEICTNCTNEAYAILIDKEEECYPSDYFVEKYVYDSTTNKFLKCFQSCEFCSQASESISDQKCISCLKGYLYSYKYLGNCYTYPNLELTDEKELINNSGVNFTSASCSKYKIASTGECIEECPLTSPYYSIEYNEQTKIHEKNSYNPPKFLFNKICYEQCP